MIEVSAWTATGRFDLSLRPVDGGGHGNFEWTAFAPVSASTDPIGDDLLRVGRAVYLADRAVRRSASIGNILRRFEVTIPVQEHERLSAVAPELERLAEFATCDVWRLEFTPLPPHHAEGEVRAPRRGEPPAVEVVALFSGGLDSLCGAARLAAESKRSLFVTHSPPGRENAESLVGDVYAALGRDRPGSEAFAAYRLETRETTGNARRAMFPEHSRRSRPFFFLCLAAATAVRAAAARVWMNENGALALSLPIRADTHGPSMARQAHSFMLHGFTEVLAKLEPGGGPPPVFDNPFIERTKGEACLELEAAGRLAGRAMSCEYTGHQRALFLRWLRDHPRRRREFGRGPQCGLCIPCLVRRAALRRADIEDPGSAYFADAPHLVQVVARRGNAVAPFGTKDPPPLLNMVASNVVHLPRFCTALREMNDREFGLRYLPELRANRDVQSAAALSPSESLTLMQRFADEVLGFMHAA